MGRVTATPMAAFIGPGALRRDPVRAGRGRLAERFRIGPTMTVCCACDQGRRGGAGRCIARAMRSAGRVSPMSVARRRGPLVLPRSQAGCSELGRPRRRVLAWCRRRRPSLGTASGMTSPSRRSGSDAEQPAAQHRSRGYSSARSCGGCAMSATATAARTIRPKSRLAWTGFRGRASHWRIARDADGLDPRRAGGEHRVRRGVPVTRVGSGSP